MASTSAPTRQDAAADDAASSEPRRPTRSTIPEKIDLLFEEIRPPGEDRKYTYQEISDRAAEAGYTISRSWLQALHRDPSKKPKIEALEAIAAGFRIPPVGDVPPVAYFFNDAAAAKIESRLAEIADTEDIRAAMERPEVREIVNMLLRASPETLRAFMPMLERALELDALNTAGPSSAEG
jgi:transcriptional regulator with XRE-family HTH domain